MSAVFLEPKAFTYLNGGTATMAGAGNLRFDEPGLVWRSSGTSGVFLVVQYDGSPIDTIALVDNNLRPTDTIRVRMGATTASVNGVAPLDFTFNAWEGIAPLGAATSIHFLASPVTYPFIRLDISSPGNPDGHIQASRLVLSKKFTNDGVDYGDDETFEDGSSVEDGLGFTTVDPYGGRVGRRLTVSHIKQDDYYTNWRGFLYRVGRKIAWLFLPTTDPTYLQQQMSFVRINTTAKVVNQTTDQFRVELGVLSVG
jgi:hypothetical protein